MSNAARPQPLSIRRQLLIILLVIVIGAWSITGVLSYLDARRELADLLDAHLAHTASLLTARGVDDAVTLDAPPGLHRYSHEVVFQRWENGVLRSHSTGAPGAQRLSPLSDGFSDATIDGVRWRVFSLSDTASQRLVQVGERYDGRDRLAAAIATDITLPIGVALPLVGVLVWAAVGRGVRALTLIGREVALRAPDSLAPLDVSAAPTEIVPLVENLNRLFGRVTTLLDHERRFTADAAHELRTPLAAMRAQAQVAQGATTDADRSRALDGVMAGSDRASRVVDQLLTLARVDQEDVQVTRRACDLRAVLTAAIAEIAPAALSKGVEIALLENGPVWVFGDSALLEILCRNLLENAVRYSPAHTGVRAEVSQTGARALVIVTDEGRGVCAEDLQHLGRRFYRALGTPESGSGLGLSIATRIVDLHHGTMTFEPSSAGTGLRVTVSIPLPDDEAAPDE